MTVLVRPGLRARTMAVAMAGIWNAFLGSRGGFYAACTLLRRVLAALILYRDDVLSASDPGPAARALLNAARASSRAVFQERQIDLIVCFPGTENEHCTVSSEYTGK